MGNYFFKTTSLHRSSLTSHVNTAPHSLDMNRNDYEEVNHTYTRTSSDEIILFCFH